MEFSQGEDEKQTYAHGEAPNELSRHVRHPDDDNIYSSSDHQAKHLGVRSLAGYLKEYIIRLLWGLVQTEQRTPACALHQTFHWPHFAVQNGHSAKSMCRNGGLSSA